MAGLCKLVQAFDEIDHGFLFALNTLVKSNSFEDNIRAACKVCCETSFYGLVDLITFGELKVSKDFVRVSTHSVDQRVYLHFLVFFIEAVEASSIAIAFEAFDPSFPLLRFL